HEAERVAPFALLPVDRAEGEPADGDRDDERAEPVEPARGALGAALLDVPRRRPERDEQERHVDEEHGPPGHRVDEDPADEGAEDGRRGGGGRPQAERAALRLATEGHREESERARYEERARDALEDPEQDEE